MNTTKAGNIVMYQFSGELTEFTCSDPNPPLAVGDPFTGYFTYDFNVHPADAHPDSTEYGMYGGQKGFMCYAIVFDTAVFFSQTGYIKIHDAPSSGQSGNDGYGIESGGTFARSIGLFEEPLGKLFLIEDISVSLDTNSPNILNTDSLPPFLDVKAFSSGSIAFHSLPDDPVKYFSAQGIITEMTSSPLPKPGKAARELLGSGLMRLLNSLH